MLALIRISIPGSISEIRQKRDGRSSLKITYDRIANAANIYLMPEYYGKHVSYTYLCDPSEIHGMIYLDFDEDGKLTGIEIIDADKFLHKELLDMADIISN